MADVVTLNGKIAIRDGKFLTGGNGCCCKICKTTWESFYDCNAQTWSTPSVVDSSICTTSCNDTNWTVDPANPNRYTRVTCSTDTCTENGDCTEPDVPTAPTLTPDCRCFREYTSLYDCDAFAWSTPSAGDPFCRIYDPSKDSGLLAWYFSDAAKLTAKILVDNNTCSHCGIRAGGYIYIPSKPTFSDSQCGCPNCIGIPPLMSTYTVECDVVGYAGSDWNGSWSTPYDYTALTGHHSITLTHSGEYWLGRVVNGATISFKLVCQPRYLSWNGTKSKANWSLAIGMPHDSIGNDAVAFNTSPVGAYPYHYDCPPNQCQGAAQFGQGGGLQILVTGVSVY